MMRNACFNGCSFTVGNGFDEKDRDLYIYDRLVSKYFNFQRTNIAVSGSSNHNIFMRTAEAINGKKYDIVFTQWTALNRLWLSPGPDTFYFLNDDRFSDFTYRDLYISEKDKRKITDLFLILNHDYQNIIDLIDYCSILCELAKSNSVKLFFINGLVPWQQDLTVPISNNLADSLSDYSKSILDFNQRPDREILLYFSKLQDKFKLLDQTKWVNLFDSFGTASVDIGPQGHHPGIQSHNNMATQIINKLLVDN